MKLHLFKTTRGHEITSQGKGCGKLKDLYFEDGNWVVRYLVADTKEGILKSDHRLISTVFVKPGASLEDETIPVDLTPEQIDGAPSWERDKPISRQYELKYFDYYQLQPYWFGTGLWGTGLYPSDIRKTQKAAAENAEVTTSQPTLRSADEVIGYSINSNVDDRWAFGSIDDLIFDSLNWKVRYFVVDTRKFLPSKSVLIDPEWISSINWIKGEASVNVSKDQIKSAPAYDGAKIPSKSYQVELYRHFRKDFQKSGLSELDAA